MRINTTDNYEWRKGLYDDMAEIFNENTRSGGIDASAIFAREMIKNLERAADHPDMTEELADLLSTSKVEVEYEVQSGVSVDD